MVTHGERFRESLARRGVTRRDFLEFCGLMASVLALPGSAGRAAAQIAEALATKRKPSLVWLELQDCAGNTESFLRAARPSVADIVLDTLSLDYHETLMAAAGHRAEEQRARIMEEHAGSYLVVVEGSIPTGAGGAYCTIGGRSALDIVREACAGAAATIAVGSCAAYGGIPAAAPNPTGAVSVEEAVPGLRNLVNMPACPMNGDNLAALVTYYVTYGRIPPLDSLHRPLFAYGKLIHDACERRGHYDAGQYVEAWGDEAHRDGWCLYKMGCKGPVTYQNCPEIGWNDGTSWPIGCGHPCIGCAEPKFWDRMTPFYAHLPGVPGFGVHSDIDTVGAWATAGVAAAFTAHGLVQLGRERAARRAERRLAEGAGREEARDG